MKRVGNKHIMGLGGVLLWAIFWFAFLVSAPIRAEVELPHGEYYENVVDLRVKTLGGFIEVKRTWYKGRWHFNRAWDALIVEYDSSNGSVLRLGRSYDDFKKSADGIRFITDKRRSISQTGTGFRWEDRRGNWIEYDSEGRIHKYGDRNNVEVTFEYDAQGRKLGAFDHFGTQVLWYEYDSEGRVSSIRDQADFAQARKAEYRWNGDHLVEVVDVRGNAWHYEYKVVVDGQTSTIKLGTSETPSTGNALHLGRTTVLLTKRTDPEGRVLAMEYDPSNRVATVAHADGITTTYKYDYESAKKQYFTLLTTAGGLSVETWYNNEGLAIRRDVNGEAYFRVEESGRTKSYIDLHGNKTINEYDTVDNVVRRSYPDGSTESFSYDRYSNVTSETDANGVTSQYQYDAQGNLVRATEAVGTAAERVTEYTVDEYGRTTEIRYLGDANTTTSTRSFSYDDSGNVITETDGLAATTAYVYDITGNLVERTDRRGNKWSYEYDSAGALLKETDPLGHPVQYIYDKTGYRIQSIDAGGKVTSFAYDGRGNLVRTTDPLGNVRTNEYDDHDALTRATDESGLIDAFSNDNAGRVVRGVDGAGNTYSTEYPRAGSADSGGFFQAKRVAYPTFEQYFKYDSRNRVTLDTAVLQGTSGLSTGYSYDPEGRLTSETDPNGKTTYFDYDARGNVVKITDVLGNAISAEYDDRDNLIAVVNQRGYRTRFEYDANDRLVREVKPLGQSTQYEYDADDNLTGVLDAKGQKLVLQYDAAGRQVAEYYYVAGNHGTPTSSISYQYDERNRLVSWNDGTVSSTISYDDLGRKTGESVDYGDFVLSYQYDYRPNGQKKSFTGPDGITYTYNYDSAGRLLGVQIPNVGAVTVNQYEWLAPRRITLPGGTSREYTYIGLFSPQSITVRDPAGNVLADLKYNYDHLLRVAEKTLDSTTYAYSYDDLQQLTAVAGEASSSFEYDQAGNRQLTGEAWIYNDNDELVSRGETGYEYDANGNLIEKRSASAVIRYVYDTADRLIRVEDGTGVILARYGYDPYDRRLWKEVGGKRTYFLYADEGLVGEYDSVGAQQRAYGFLPDTDWSTDPIFLRASGQYYFYQNDHLGTPFALTTVSGRVVWQAAYDAMGRAVVSGAATIENNLRFPGQYYDSETGLHYNWRRYYDPETGRYTTSDPIGRGDGLNLYQYSANDPVHKLDPTGEFWPVVWIIARVAAPYVARAALRWGGRAAAAYGFYSIGSAVHDFITTGCIDFGSLIMDVLPFGGAAKVFRQVMKRAPGDCNSFTGETLVHTDRGLIPIQEIKEGDIVLSYAEWSDETSYQPVEAVITGERDYDLVVLSLVGGERIEATGGHPFYVHGQGWRDAERLVVGDRLYLQERGSVRIKDIRREARNEAVYNLSVANTHTYYVGEDGVLVHNAKPCGGKPPIKWGAQEKHFPGHNSYTPGRSTMTSDPTKLAEKAGTGQQVGKVPVGQPGSKERVDFGETIGTYIDQAGNASPTTNGIIHYSKDGIHVVPARP